MTLQFSLKTTAAEKLRTQCLVLPVQAGRLTPTGAAIDARLDNALSAILKAGDLGKKPGSTQLVPTSVKGLPRILLVSMGPEDTIKAPRFAEAVRSAFRAVLASPATDAFCCLHEAHVELRELPWRVGQIVLAAREVRYRFDDYKSKPEAAPALKDVVLGVESAADQKALASRVARMSDLADGIDTARDLGNQPPNVCHPSFLASQAQKLGRQLKLKVEVLDQKQMASLGMGALLAVAQGSAQPPKLIVMHYRGAGARQAPIVLVGKGITFDTGGISLKPGADMDEMKYDMSGAGSVFGTLQAVAQMKLKINLTVIIAAAENMPSGSAARPGDIVTTMSGQTPRAGWCCATPSPTPSASSRRRSSTWPRSPVPASLPWAISGPASSRMTRPCRRRSRPLAMIPATPAGPCRWTTPTTSSCARPLPTWATSAAARPAPSRPPATCRALPRPIRGRTWTWRAWPGARGPTRAPRVVRWHCSPTS